MRSRGRFTALPSPVTLVQEYLRLETAAMKQANNLKLVWSKNWPAKHVTPKPKKRLSAFGPPSPQQLTLNYGDSLALKFRELAERKPLVAAAVERVLDKYLKGA